MSKFCVILPAAGKSSRYGDRNYKKQFAMLNNQAVWLHSATLFLNRSDVAQVIVVVAPEDREMFESKFRANIAILGITVVEGGRERADSIQNAIAAIRPECDFVAVHDAARPCVTDALVSDVFRVARRTGAAILAIPVADTMKKVEPVRNAKRAARKEPKVLSLDSLIPDDPEEDTSDVGDGRILGTLDRTNVWAAQTPQVFRRDWFEEIYAKRDRNSSLQTDDAMLFEAAGKSVSVVEGSTMNLKITTKDDLKMTEAILRIQSKGPKKPIHPFDDARFD